MEVVQRLDFFAGLVQNTLVNGIWYAVVDELGQDETIFAGIEHLECVGREGQAVANVWIASKDSVDMARKLCSLIFVDGVGDVCRRTLDLDAAATTANAVLGRVPRIRRRVDAGGCAGSRAGWACGHALLGGGRDT